MAQVSVAMIRKQHSDYAGTFAFILLTIQKNKQSVIVRHRDCAKLDSFILRKKKRFSNNDK